MSLRDESWEVFKGKKSISRLQHTCYRSRLQHTSFPKFKECKYHPLKRLIETGNGLNHTLEAVAQTIKMMMTVMKRPERFNGSGHTRSG